MLQSYKLVDIIYILVLTIRVIWCDRWCTKTPLLKCCITVHCEISCKWLNKFSIQIILILEMCFKRISSYIFKLIKFVLFLYTYNLEDYNNICERG